MQTTCFTVSIAEAEAMLENAVKQANHPLNNEATRVYWDSEVDFWLKALQAIEAGKAGVA